MERCFILASESFYAKSYLNQQGLIDEVITILFVDDKDEFDGTTEAFFRWFENGKIVPQFEIWGDSWHVLEEYLDVFKAVKERPLITPHELCDVLKSLGFIDKTKRQNKYGIE